MSHSIHEVKDDEGRGDLDVSEFAGGVRDGVRRGPMLQFTVTEYGPICGGADLLGVPRCAHGAARLIQLRYAEVESLHQVLGAWLFDCLVTGRVGDAERRKP